MKANKMRGRKPHQSEAPLALPTLRRSRVVAERGIKTAEDFVLLMEAIIQDLASEVMTHQRANAMTNAGGKMLKAAEMVLKHGTRNRPDGGLSLPLGQTPSKPPTPVKERSVA
jgi:hypothetical protein